MIHYTKQDIIRLVKEEDVEFIRLQFADVCGTLKNMAVTTGQLNMVLNNKCTFDGAAIDGFSDCVKSELFLVPDLDTFTIFPWRPQQGKVARFICDVVRGDGTPFEGDSRQVLKKVIREAAGLDGMKRKLELGECGKASVKNQDAIPASLGEAIRAFAADDFVKRLLGEHIFDIYARTKKAEWDDYCRQVTEWEINSYLLRI